MFINEVPNGAELSSIIINELRDMYGVKYRKDKKLKDQSNVGLRRIFGLPLNKLDFADATLSNGSQCRIPAFVSDACARIMDHIDVEGLFRKAGSSSRQKEIREKLEAGFPMDDSCNVIDVANILKYFFRELPEPLLPPGNFQETILRCLVCKGTIERKISAVKMVCLLLPVTSLNTLIYFMQFLNLVSTHSPANKMTAKNLAIIFAPGLMPINENCGQRLNSHVQIIEILIQHAHDLGVIGSDLINRMPNITIADGSTDELVNFTMYAEQTQMKMPETDKKKKKRRSGSLTRVFNGIRKIVGAIGSSENLDETYECEITDRTPRIAKTKKRKVLEASAFSSKKKKDVLSLLPNGGVLPSTPMHGTDNTKPAKKTRLSLGTKRFTKNGSQQSTGSKSSIVSSLERRWSFMVTGTTNRHNQSQKEALNTIQDVTFTSPAPDASVTSIKDNNWESQMTKSEYEAIKVRVSAIETRISKEFTKLQSSMSNTSLDLIDVLDHRNGPERVLEKFERTVEETENMNTSPMTEQLAKQLGRGLKIRSSADARVCRSPSARKIGSIRRRSQENVRLTRTKTWHLGSNALPSSPHIVRPARITRNSPLQPLTLTNSPTVDRNIHIPRVNLKRGKPNTFQNGLRSLQKPDTAKQIIEHASEKQIIVPDAVNEAIRKNDLNADLQNENWVCADIFFEGCATPKDVDDTPMNTSRNNSAKSSATRSKPVRKRLYVDTPTQPHLQATANDTTKTPMLPPRLPVLKKTPAKTPHQPLSTCRNLFTPLMQQEQQIAGRASIARLRNQNAGMVMAKAKLFDNLVTDEPTNKRNKPVNKVTESTDVLNRTRLNQSISRLADSPRRAKLSNVNGIQRRQQLRQQRTPVKKTPGQLDKSLVTLTEPSNRIARALYSPLDVSTRSPITRRMAAMDATPNSQRHMVTKPPRRIARTPQKNKNAAQF